MNSSLNLASLNIKNDQKNKMNLTFPDPLVKKIEVSILSVLFCFTLIGNLLVIAYLVLRIKKDKSLCCNAKVSCKKITRMSFYIVSFLYSI